VLSKQIGLTWLRRILLAVPIATATILTLLISSADRFHLPLQPVAGYGFLFGTPWAWLLDHDWLGNVRSRWVESLVGYAILLWIPALLYSACLWLLLRVLGFCGGRIRV
jgi:hypothetical protein